MTPVYTPPHRTDLIIYRKRDPSTMTPTEYILHHNTVFLVLEEEEDSGGPIINTVMHVSIIYIIYRGCEVCMYTVEPPSLSIRTPLN